MTRFFAIAVIVTLLAPRRVVHGFHVDSSPKLTHYTYLQREQPPQYLQPHDHASHPPKAYTDQERTWRFPDASKVRPIGDKTLSNLKDEERLWQAPHPNQVRHSSQSLGGAYLDQDRMWRRPHYEMTRHQTHFPEHLTDDELLFWWNRNRDSFRNMLLEEDEVDAMKEAAAAAGGTQPYSSSSDRTMFRRQRPTARFSRHPHSLDGRHQMEDDVITTTMTEEDRLGWLTENTHRLLAEEESDERSLEE